MFFAERFSKEQSLRCDQSEDHFLGGQFCFATSESMLETVEVTIRLQTVGL